MIISAAKLRSQYYFYNDKYYNSFALVEAGLSAGGFNCLTDLGGRKGSGKPFLKDINWKNTHPGGGIYITVLFDQVFALRAEGSIGRVSASDQVLKNDQSVARDRYHRNLHFQSTITEFFLAAELLPLSLIGKEDHPLFSPYLLAGIGFFKFNPRAMMKDQWVDLHPLHTEGQGFKEYSGKEHYRLTQLNFPVGLGVRYEISALLNMRFELVYRFLKTDYLDDVSAQYINPSYFYSNLNPRDAGTAVFLADRSGELRPGIFKQEGEIRGNPSNKDGYYSCSIKLGLILNRKRR